MRSAGELAAVVAANPLRGIATDPSKYLVGFLAGDPSVQGVQFVETLDVAPDGVCLVGLELYLWCPSGVLDSPLNKVKWDRQLGVEVTMRNWNTVAKLADLTAV